MNENLIVSLKDIVVDFDGQKVLDGLSLDIHDKEFVTFLGPSGCGKTTTLRVIAGFITPKSGNVFFDGKDIGAASISCLAASSSVWPSPAAWSTSLACCCSTSPWVPWT